MKRHLAWLLAGAALTLTAGAAVAADQATDAKAQADKDSQASRIERREVRVYRSDDGGPQVRVYGRRDSDHRPDVFVMRRGEGRAEHLKALLQLRPDQEGALKVFLDATGPQPHVEHAPRIDKSVDVKRSTLDKLADAERRLDEQQAGSRKRIAATRAFYNQLDERQKRAFDEMPMVLVVGPDIGPMLIPTPTPIMMHLRHGGDFDSFDLPVPPRPLVPPVPPTPPSRRP